MVQKYLLCGHQAYVTIFAEAITQEERKENPPVCGKMQAGGFLGRRQRSKGIEESVIYGF